MNEKTGGYINKLVVTCLRSGLNRAFRVLQKPERAPIRALRASSSGRFSLNIVSLITFHTWFFLLLFTRVMLLFQYMATLVSPISVYVCFLMINGQNVYEVFSGSL